MERRDNIQKRSLKELYKLQEHNTNKHNRKSTNKNIRRALEKNWNHSSKIQNVNVENTDVHKDKGFILRQLREKLPIIALTI